MFWNKKTSEGAGSATGQGAATDLEALARAEREARETLVAFLEVIGEYAFNVGEIDAARVRELSAGWAKHVRAEAGKYEWERLHKFFTTVRQREHAYVTTDLSTLRGTVGQLIESFRKSVSEDREADQQIEGKLEMLGTGLDSDSIEQIKAEAASTMKLVSQVTSARRERQKTNDESLKIMRSELDDARKKMVADGLTGLFNRSAFDEHVAKVVELQEPACLIMVDADHFKNVNDTHGHPAGDAVLKALADTIKGTFARKDDFVARYGGEEFVAILGLDSVESAKVAADRLLEAVRALEIRHEDLTLKIKVSLGIAMLGVGETETLWIARADNALYQAKAGGRDQAVVAEETEAIEAPPKAA